MANRPPILDMTPDGAFRPAPLRPNWTARLVLVALGAAFIAGAVATTVLVISAVLVVVPAVLALAAAAYVSLRLQASRGRGRDIMRRD